ncbi:MAG TPA: VWA domain-containing protein, partial [Pyrinomonadaceae bacterium]|nr:VWA domain-containing protein [Pyrinomonadaceae bacterium]
TVAFLVDISDSMRGVAAKRTRHIISTFIKAADPRNNYVLFVFNNRFKKVGEYAGDRAGCKSLLAALEHQKYGGGTALYSSARDALRKVVEAQGVGKLAFIIITDGVDNASFANYRQMGDSLDTFGGFACAFVVSTPSYVDGVYTPESETSRIASRLSDAIGAEAFVARGLEEDVSEIAQRVAEMMTLSVELSFYPEFPAGEIGAHSIRVEYRNRPRDIRVTSRKRYIIESPSARANHRSF